MTESRRPVDLEVVRLARANLRTLVTNHPELGGPSGTANRAGWVETLREIDMSENDEQIVVRLPKPLVERVDAHVERLKKAQPGLRVTRSDAVRMLLSLALDGAESKRGKR